MVNFPIWIPGFDSHSPAPLDLFVSSDCSILLSTRNFWELSGKKFFICSTVTFPSIGRFWSYCGLSFHLLSLNSKEDVIFHCIAYDYFCADWDGPYDYLSNIPWVCIFKLDASAVVTKFSMWVHVGIAGQASLISMVFSCLCCWYSLWRLFF